MRKMRKLAVKSPSLAEGLRFPFDRPYLPKSLWVAILLTRNASPAPFSIPVDNINIYDGH